jgi:hypothetical protein
VAAAPALPPAAPPEAMPPPAVPLPAVPPTVVPPLAAPLALPPVDEPALDEPAVAPVEPPLPPELDESGVELPQLMIPVDNPRTSVGSHFVCMQSSEVSKSPRNPLVTGP